MKMTGMLKGQTAGGILAIIIGGLLIAVLYGALIGEIADSTIGINNSASNVTGATATLTDLIPVVIAIMVVLGVFTMVGFKVAIK